jgi:hypothetical protein
LRRARKRSPKTRWRRPRGGTRSRKRVDRECACFFSNACVCLVRASCALRLAPCASRLPLPLALESKSVQRCSNRTISG